MSNEAIKYQLRVDAKFIMVAENCAGFLLPLGDGKFVVAGTPETIRNLLKTEGT